MTFRALLVPTIALTLVGLSGCALSQGSGLSPHESRDAMYDVLRSAQVMLGGIWTIEDDPTPRGCVIPLWVDGSQYPALRVGTAPDDTERAATLVTTAWAELGYEITRTDVADIIEIRATRPLGELLVLRVGADSMTLQGESECRTA